MQKILWLTFVFLSHMLGGDAIIISKADRSHYFFHPSQYIFSSPGQYFLVSRPGQSLFSPKVNILLSVRSKLIFLLKSIYIFPPKSLFQNLLSVPWDYTENFNFMANSFAKITQTLEGMYEPLGTNGTCGTKWSFLCYWNTLRKWNITLNYC